MTYIIVKRSENDMRNAAHEARKPGYRQGQNIDGYARGMEEADSLLRSRGRDNPNQKPILVEDHGKAAAELDERALKGRRK